jgi:hypothetical protein
MNHIASGFRGCQYFINVDSIDFHGQFEAANQKYGVIFDVIIE